VRFCSCTHSVEIGSAEGLRCLKFRVLEMPFPTISAEGFYKYATENEVVSFLFYPSLEFSVTYDKKWG